MEQYFHIPSDEEAGRAQQGSERRVTFLCTCTLCKKDFEIRDGKWIDTWTKSGKNIRIKICPECYENETTVSLP